MTSKMILHHYKPSPFSEKIRAMFGYAEIEWQSAISPAAPPRPIVGPLAGGYRKIPVAQIGADIFCDTRIISAEIAAMSGLPNLDAANCTQEIQDFVAQTDGPTFWAIATGGTPFYMLKMMLTNFAPWEAARLVKDRSEMARAMKSKRFSRPQAKQVVEAFIADLEAKLASSEFLFGDQVCIADFSAFHIVWFGRKTQGSHFMAAAPNVKRWFNKIAQMGHGTNSSISKRQVFAEARDAEPRALSQEQQGGDLIGAMVDIQPTDYALDSVHGKVVGSDKHRWILARETEAFGLLHVHFPKQGFAVTER